MISYARNTESLLAKASRRIEVAHYRGGGRTGQEADGVGRRTRADGGLTPSLWSRQNEGKNQEFDRGAIPVFDRPLEGSDLAGWDSFLLTRQNEVRYG
jgi:hypothetical protein